MPIRTIIFDIGGVLEITPRLGIIEKWGAKLNLPTGELNQRLSTVWHAGSFGEISSAQVHANIGEIMGWDEAQVNAFMDDIWTEYLGELNVELVEYVKQLRPKYQTAILSNSFVGAREKEQERYRFHELVDLIIYSHEEGIAKPDPRLFAITCERLEVQPDELIFVDDVEVIIQAARDFGIHGVVFKENSQAIAEIEAYLNTPDSGSG
jgi:epoxide hydrolase-like predicted phosphatase